MPKETGCQPGALSLMAKATNIKLQTIKHTMIKRCRVSVPACSMIYIYDLCDLEDLCVTKGQTDQLS